MTSYKKIYVREDGELIKLLFTEKLKKEKREGHEVSYEDVILGLIRKSKSSG